MSERHFGLKGFGLNSQKMELPSTEMGRLLTVLLFVPFFFFFLIHFIYFWLNWVFVAALGLSLVLASGGLLFIVGFRFLTAVASCCGAWAVGA